MTMKDSGPFELIHVQCDRKTIRIGPLDAPTDMLCGELRYSLGFKRADGEKFFIELSRDEARFFLGEKIN